MSYTPEGLWLQAVVIAALGTIVLAVYFYFRHKLLVKEFESYPMEEQT
jgi:hypothetical protein